MGVFDDVITPLGEVPVLTEGEQQLVDRVRGDLERRSDSAELANDARKLLEIIDRLVAGPAA